ncbi:hypothetical protein O9992_11160 [Vibrio lentus]|nr:hypothetical protein [Vibrio lentus]
MSRLVVDFQDSGCASVGCMSTSEAMLLFQHGGLVRHLKKQFNID